MADFILTIGAATEAENVVSVGPGPNFAIVLTAGPSSFTIVVGDILTDSAANDYLITAVTDQTHFTVIDYKSVGFDPSALGGTVLRSDVSLTNAEVDIGNYASSTQDVEWRCMNDSTLNDKLAYNAATLGGSGKLTITSPIGERHTGDAGTGFILQPSISGTAILLSNIVQPEVVISFIEFSGHVTTATTEAIKILALDTSGNTLIDSVIIHGYSGTAQLIGIFDQGHADTQTTIRNSVIFDLDGGAVTRLVQLHTTSFIENCTLLGTSQVSQGINLASSTTVVCKNTAVFDCAANVVVGGGSTLNGNNNGTDDASDPGSTTSNQLSLTAADEFKDLTGGSEDFRLKLTSTLFGNGADLSGTFTKDITGRTRSVPFAIGAHQNPRAGWIVPVVLGV